MRRLPGWVIALMLFLAAMIVPWAISRLISAIAINHIDFDTQYPYPVTVMYGVETHLAATRNRSTGQDSRCSPSPSATLPPSDMPHVTIEVENAIARRTPGLDSQTVCVLHRGERFAVVAQSTGDAQWYLIQANLVDRAWVSADSVILSPAEAVIPVATAAPTVE